MMGNSMNKELKAKWTAALRSGEYHQGKDQLRTTLDRFCCLGVLCNIVHPEDWHHDHLLGWAMHGNGRMPEDRFRDEVGLADDDVCTLSDLNDSGKDFLFIADWIEKNL